MRAEKIPAEELKPLSGNYWRLIDGTKVIVQKMSMPTAVQTEAQALEIFSHKDDPEPEPNFDILDQTTLNRALSAPGSVVRALALLMLQEINNLRTRAGLQTYTQEQLVQALKAKMR